MLAFESLVDGTELPEDIAELVSQLNPKGWQRKAAESLEDVFHVGGCPKKRKTQHVLTVALWQVRASHVKVDAD